MDHLGSRVRHDFAGPGPYPTVMLPQTAPARFAHSANPSVIIFPLSLTQLASHFPRLFHPSSLPDTPEASHSASTSPASSVSPQTPPVVHGPGLLKAASPNVSPPRTLRPRFRVSIVSVFHLISSCRFLPMPLPYLPTFLLISLTLPTWLGHSYWIIMYLNHPTSC